MEKLKVKREDKKLEFGVYEFYDLVNLFGVKFYTIYGHCANICIYKANIVNACI